MRHAEGRARLYHPLYMLRYRQLRVIDAALNPVLPHHSFLHTEELAQLQATAMAEMQTQLCQEWSRNCTAAAQERRALSS